MAQLEYLIGDELHTLLLHDVDTFVGRSAECAVQILEDHEISRVHCSIQRQSDGTYVLVDEDSRNGTFLNDERVMNEEKPLKEGDRIRVGHTSLVFREGDLSRTGLLFQEVEQQMKHGQGYHTILGKIIRKTGPGHKD